MCGSANPLTSCTELYKRQALQKHLISRMRGYCLCIPTFQKSINSCYKTCFMLVSCINKSLICPQSFSKTKSSYRHHLVSKVQKSCKDQWCEFSTHFSGGTRSERFLSVQCKTEILILNGRGLPLKEWYAKSMGRRNGDLDKLCSSEIGNYSLF